MRGICIYVHCQGSRSPAKPSGSYAKFIDLIKHFFFQFLCPRYIGVCSASRVRASLAIRACASSKSTAYSYAYNHRRTGIGACIPHCRQDCIFNPFNPIRSVSPEYPAHIFTSKALWSNFYLYFVTFYNTIMNNRRGVIFCILTDYGIPSYDRLSKISFLISLTDAFVYGIFQNSTYKMHVLTDFYKLSQPFPYPGRWESYLSPLSEDFPCA